MTRTGNLTDSTASLLERLSLYSCLPKDVRRHVITLVTALVQLLVAQGVGIGTSTPHPSAILELSSMTKGLLIPRLTETERQALPDPATGLLIFNTTTGELNFYNGSS